MRDDEEVGKRIERLRTDAGLSQGELSDRLRAAGVNWSQGTLSRVEAGTRPVRFTEAFTLASVLGVDTTELAPAGGGPAHAYRQQLASVERSRLLVRQAEHRLRDQVVSAHILRFVMELAEGKTGPYVVHSWMPAIVDRVAWQLRTSNAKALEMMGVPSAIVASYLEAVELDFKEAKSSKLDGDWVSPSYAPGLSGWIADHIERTGLDPDQPYGTEWTEMVRDIYNKLQAAAIVELCKKQFPFISEAEDVWTGPVLKSTFPIVDGIDIAEVEARLNDPRTATTRDARNGW